MSTTVTYKGSTIATVSNDTATLETAGTWMEDDLTLTDVTGAAPSGNINITSAGVTDVTNYATATVASGSATPASSISATGATVSTGTNTLTLSKTVSNTPQVTAGLVSSGTAGNSSVSLTASVNTRDSSDLSASGATVTAPAGYYGSSASKTVASGTEGTPTATKGAVNNHSVSVTPSVTNTAGYISGGTKTGTAVTVSASELDSGTAYFYYNNNGTFTTNDVIGYANASIEVDVPASAVDSGTKSITSNGNGQDVIGYAYANVNVPNTYSAGDEGKVVDNGALVSQTSDTYTSNGTYDTTKINSVTVNVSGGTPAISVVDTLDANGGTIREITALDISDTTAVAADVASGKYFYTANGTKTAGTASGGGSLGGLANMVDVNDPECAVGYMLSAMKNGNTAGGTFTLSSTLSNTTETLLVSTGLTVVHGIIFACPTYDVATNLGTGQSNKFAFIWNYEFTSAPDTKMLSIGFQQTGNNWGSRIADVNGIRADAPPLQGVIRFDGGNVYYTARYNNNNNYQIVRSNVEYEWLAW